MANETVHLEQDRPYAHFPRRGMKSVSVMIPTKNRMRDLERTVETLLQQTVLPSELIIIDQSSSDEARTSMLAVFARLTGGGSVHLRYHHAPNLLGLTEARNLAMRLASGEIWLFLDDDVVLESNFLAEVLAAYDSHPDAVGISGIITNYPKPYLGEWIWTATFMRHPFHDDRQSVYRNWARHAGGRPVRVTRLGGGLMSFRADSIRTLKFDESLQGVADGEDVDFCQQLAGHTLLIAPAARLRHYQSPSGRLADHWVRRSSRAMVFLYRKNWRHGIRNRLAYAWLLFGYSLVASWAGIRRRSLGPWRALLTGIREGKAVTKSA